MPSLVPATGAVLDEILNHTYPIWGEGLSREAYGRFNHAQRKTTWGGSHLQRLALVSSDGRLLSTAKRYDLAARVDGTRLRVFGIGAVFTPVASRRQGLAAQLIEQMLESARAEGFDLALLFSAIGAEYYRRFGFEPVPLDQFSLEVLQKRGAPAIPLRGGEDRDIPFLIEVHEARAAASGWRFALDRDADFVRFTIARKRLFAGLGPPGLRELEYFVVEEGGRPAAYAVLLNSEGQRMLCECGDRDPGGARLGALLQALLARSPNHAAAPIRAWLPPRFRPPQIQVRLERPGVVMMIKPLRAGAAIAPPLTAGDMMYWLGDVV